MSASSKKTLFGGLLTFCLFALAALILWLETPTGTLQGTVLNETGKPIAGAKVLLDDWPVKRQAFTDQKGRYEISQIPAGKYYITIRMKGFRGAYLKTHEIFEGKVLDLGPTRMEPLDPRLYVNVWDETKLPEEKVVLSVDGAKVRDLNIQVYQVDLVAYLLGGGNFSDLQNRRTNPEDLTGLNQILTGAYRIPDADVPEFDFKLPMTKALGQELPAEGLFLLRVTAQSLNRDKTFYQNVLVNKTDLAMVVKQDDKNLFLYTSELGRPQAAAGVQLRLFWPRGGSLQTQSNDQGLGEFPMADIQASHQAFLMAKRGESVAYTYAPGEPYGGEAGEGYQVDPNPEGEHLYTMIYTERPLYRPGQQVYFKGIVRRRNVQGTYDLPAPGDVDVVIEDPRGTLIKETTLPLNPYGGFFSSVTLDEEAELGYYTVRATVHGREFRDDFEVDEYRKPEFKLEIKPGKEHYYAGDKIAFLLDAQYFFGAPVEAEVDYTLYKSNYYFVPADDDTLPELWVDEGYVGGYGEYLTDGKVTTDAQGQARVEYETPKAVEDYRYTLRTTSTDISGRMIEREGDIIVTAGDFFFRTDSDQFLAFPEQPYELTVITRNYKNEPVSVDYTLKIERQIYDPVVKAYHYKKESKLKGKTDETGKALSKVIAKRGGYYRLLLEGKDDAGRKVEYVESLWVSGSGKDSEDFALEQGVQIITDKKKYLPGETAKVFVVGPNRDSQVWITLEGQELYRSFMVQLDGFSKEFTLPLEKDWIPNLYLTATSVGKKGIYAATTEAQISAKEHFLNVEVKPGKDKYQPGEEISYQIITKDPSGKPVPAELSLGVVDEKIYALKADTTNIRNLFWGLRPNRVMTNFSFNRYYSGGIAKEDRNLLRRNFKDTAFWMPFLTTDENGQAQVKFQLPDNLTTWRATVVASTLATAVGQQTNKVVSTKPLIARIAAPRFFRERDTVYLLAMIHNYTEGDQTLTVNLGLEGGLQFVDPKDDQERSMSLKPKEVASFAFPVKALKPGTAKLQLLAKNDKVQDGVELAIPVLPHGIADHFYSQGALAGSTVDLNTKTKLDINVPPGTDPDRSEFDITLDTTLVGQLLGSLDYLIQYPYGCVEQTLSRFLPALMVSRLYDAIGFPQSELKAKLPRVLKRGLKRIYRMQNSGGGWGWWSGDPNNAFMTAYAMYGLIQAKRYGLEVDNQVYNQGRKALTKILKEGTNPEANYFYGAEGTKYFVSYVASLVGVQTPIQVPTSKALLNEPMAQALLILTMEAQGKHAEALPWLGSLKGMAKCEMGLCHLEQGGRRWPKDILATAWTLQALIAGGEGNTFLTEGMAKWLLDVRQGGRWRTTLDTATVLYALSAYAQDRTPNPAGVKARFLLNGKELETVNVTSPHFIRRFLGCSAAKPESCGPKKGFPLKSGPNDFTLENLLEQVLYYQTALTVFSTSEDLSPTSHGITIQREYFELVTERHGHGGRNYYQTKPLPQAIPKGTTVGVRITLTNKDDLYYLVVEDPLPSGFEVIDGIRFDKKTTSGRTAVRDEKIVFFRNHLKPGTHVFNYGLVPELAGEFHVMPTTAEEMYQPIVRGTGPEKILKVENK